MELELLTYINSQIAEAEKMLKNAKDHEDSHLEYYWNGVIRAYKATKAQISFQIEDMLCKMPGIITNKN